MSEAEVLEILNLHASNAITSFTVYVTFTFAYLTTAYVAGPRLSPSQVVIATGLYLASVCVPIFVLLAHTKAIELLVDGYPTILDSYALWHIPWASLISTVMMLGVFAGLYFMFNIRQTGQD